MPIAARLLRRCRDLGVERLVVLGVHQPTGSVCGIWHWLTRLYYAAFGLHPVYLENTTPPSR